MKKKIIIVVVSAVLAFMNIVALAQNEETKNYSYVPKWVPSEGYWVVENNLKNSHSTILYFYNNDNLLIYKERVVDVKIKLSKRKTKLYLQKILVQSLALYNQRKKVGENEGLALKIISKNNFHQFN